MFSVDAHMGLTSSPIHMRPPEPDSLPLHVYVINGWPHTENSVVKLSVKVMKNKQPNYVEHNTNEFYRNNYADLLAIYTG